AVRSDSVAGQRRHASLRAQVAEPDALPGPRVGMVEYFRRDDRDGVESVLADLRAMGVTDLRTIVSWAEWDSPEGSTWYDWLLPRLAREVNLIPCVLYTSLSQGVVPRVSA